MIHSEILTELPVEFNEKAHMVWKVTKFHDKCFDGIIGQNLLKPIGAIINMAEDYMIINGNKINFIQRCPFEYNQIHQLSPIDSNREVFENFFKDLNSEEKKYLKELLHKYGDLFFKEGDQLTNTNGTEHRITTTSDKPIYSKIYRYPQIHETEISKKINEMLKQ